MNKREQIDKEYLELIRSESQSYSDSCGISSFSIVNLKEDEFIDERKSYLIECPVSCFLLKVFSNHQLNSKVISAIPQKLLPSIISLLSKKFTFDNLSSNFEIKKKVRRTEDQFKFVFRKGIKYLIKQFKIKNNIEHANKFISEILFYEHYFTETCVHLGIQIEMCYLPCSKAQKSIEHCFENLDKTVSFAYIQRILNSIKFRKEFSLYLLEGFIEDCIEFRNNHLIKIASLIKKSKSHLPKLPWTNDEIYESQKRLVELITRISSNTL